MRPNKLFSGGGVEDSSIPSNSTGAFPNLMKITRSPSRRPYCSLSKLFLPILTTLRSPPLPRIADFLSWPSRRRYCSLRRLFSDFVNYGVPPPPLVPPPAPRFSPPPLHIRPFPAPPPFLPSPALLFFFFLSRFFNTLFFTFSQPPDLSKPPIPFFAGTKQTS